MKAKVVKKGLGKAPSLAAAKHALFESHAVRQKAHDARLDLQKRIQDHNFAIQQRMDAHRLRDMRADTPLTARVARDMVAPRARTLTPALPARTLTPAPPARPQRYDMTPPPAPNAKMGRTRPPRSDAMEVDGGAAVGPLRPPRTQRDLRVYQR